MDDQYRLTPDELTPPQPPASRPPRRLGGLGRSGAAAITAIGLASGGVAGGFLISHAATASPTASPTTRGGAAGPGHGDFRVGKSAELQTIATAIGITTSQLQTALRTGKTIAAVAQAHGVDPTKVIDALIAAGTKSIDTALGAGKLTKPQADAAKAALSQRVRDEVNNGHGFRPGGFGPGGFGPGGFWPGGFGPGGFGPRGGLAAGEDAQVIAGAIGISTTQLETEVRAGSTIAQVAKAHKVDPNTVISALVASENKEIDDALAKGKITQPQATAMKSMTQQRVADMVNGDFSPWHRGGPGKAPASPTPTP